MALRRDDLHRTFINTAILELAVTAKILYEQFLGVVGMSILGCDKFRLRQVYVSYKRRLFNDASGVAGRWRSRHRLLDEYIMECRRVTLVLPTSQSYPHPRTLEYSDIDTTKNMAGLEELTDMVYHERQQPGSMLCAQHALNSLLRTCHLNQKPTNH